MKKRWCWRCQCEIPMLTDEEFRLCLEAKEKGKAFVEKEISKRNIENFEWSTKINSAHNPLRYFVEMYRLLTGYDESNPNAIWHHVINAHGSDCPNCKKPLRTKEARFCAACGFGKEDFNSSETLPLVIRKPELFQ